MFVFLAYLQKNVLTTFSGRLGHSYNKLCHKPKHVLLPEGSIALSCFCGTDCSAIITDENKVLVCGGNR